jgi:hypothetical protein
MKCVAVLACGLAAAVVAKAADPVPRVYAFQVLLDGKPIGAHRFTVASVGAGRRVTSEADFKVTVLGFTAYRYRHRASEQWSGDCLDSLEASTDDDGKAASVRLVKAGDVDEITTGAGRVTFPGCLMTYAYWNPALLSQVRLLNPQTGKVDAVRVERVGSGRVAVHGVDVDAVDWRITGGEAPVDVWVSSGGEWVGLDSMVSGGKHRLSYRLP